jgi:hypothetical protein
MTVAEIADNLTAVEDIDDDYRDPDYEYSEQSDSSEDSDNEDEARDDDEARGEIRVYMQPPVERADADTDVDSVELPVFTVFTPACLFSPIYVCRFCTVLPVSPHPLPVFFDPLACIFCTLFHPYTTHFCLSFLYLLAFF